MHDPLVVAFEVRRPWPTKRPRPVREGQPRWELKVYRKHALDHEGFNPKRWWNPRMWSPFQVAFGREWYFPALVTVWHVEPKGRDSGTVCKHHRAADTPMWKVRLSPWLHAHRQRDIPEDPAAGRPWISDSAWRWHIWHWRIQIPLLGKVKRALFERCIECGRRYPWGYAPISHQWDGPSARWFRVGKFNYHHECSALASTRRTVAEDEQIIRRLFDAYRLHYDLDETAAAERVFDPQLAPQGDFTRSFNLERRMKWALGWRSEHGGSAFVPPGHPQHPDSMQSAASPTS